MPTIPAIVASSPRLKAQLFAVSFTALFLEMMVIRWVPSVVTLIAFYANLMLLSSFLGLGAGAMMARKPWRLFAWFPILFALEIGTLLLCRDVVFSTSADEIRMSDLTPTWSNHLALIAIFGINALVFVPLGQRLGALFDSLPRLSAYTWDLAGSLGGTVAFGFFSFLHFSPLWGMAVVMALFLAMSPRRRWLLDAPVFTAILAVVAGTSEPAAIWSPYHYLTVSRVETPTIAETQPPANLRTMPNPPAYSVSVNHFYYHYNTALDPARYTPGKAADAIAALASYFRFPYSLGGGRERALVLGAGGGGDVQGALASGLRHVDAVEIDPVVIEVSRRFNAGAPYFDPRVTAHVDDARSFLARATPGYDFVVYGLLDSHALFSSMANVRLDGYVYTVEGVRTAFGLLREDGVMTLAFYIEKDWLLPKLHQLVAEATGREPAMYILNRTIVFCVPKNPAHRLPAAQFQFQRTLLTEPPVGVAVPTDDWPFLYLREKTIPRDYLIAMASLLGLSVVTVALLRRGAGSDDGDGLTGLSASSVGGGGSADQTIAMAENDRAAASGFPIAESRPAGGGGPRSAGRHELHFGLLGMGFLLLETKSINDCTLYFGATWLVTVIVVTGVLIMVLAANLLAERLRAFSFWMYAPLFASLALLLLMPRDVILGLAFPARLLWTVLVVPLPVFFAGIIFSTTFRLAPVPSAAFGANLVGAMVGGFCEYLAMAVGSFRLSFLVVVAYAVSLAALRLSARRDVR